MSEYKPYIPPTHKPPRRERRARAKVMARATRKAVRDTMVQRPTTPPIYGEVIGDDIILKDPDGRDLGTLGDPVPIGERDGRTTLLKDPDMSMLIGVDMVKDKGRGWWDLGSKDGVVAKARMDLLGRLVISHSTGTLVYSLHPLAWVEDQGPIPEDHLSVALLAGRGGPETRAPKDRRP